MRDFCRPAGPVRVATATCAVVLLGGATLSAQSTNDAPRRLKIDEQLVITLAQIIENDKPKSVLQFRVPPQQTTRTLRDGQVFSAEDTIQVTYPRLNPLRVQVTAAVTSAPDPSFASVTRLVQALLETAAVIRPDLDLKAVQARMQARADAPPGTGAEQCGPLKEARTYVSQVSDTLYPSDLDPAALTKALSGWSDLIDQAPGKPGIDKAHAAIAELAKRVRDLHRRAGPLVGELQDRRNKAKAAADADPKNECLAATLQAYQGLVLDRLSVRVPELEETAKSIEALATALAPFAADGMWVEDDAGQRVRYVVASIDPSITDFRVVEVKGAFLRYDAGLTGFTSGTKSGATAKFTIAHDAPWTPEIGAGVILSDFAAPKYGTATNAAGQTIVTLVGSDSLSLDAAVVANLVVGRRGIVLPMIQIGGVPSTDSPGFLVGAGFRFVKPKLGFGVGWAHVWVNDLVGLEVNSPVTGTTQIEEHIELQGRNRPYFMIQYSF